jgi:hypothetical protein
MKRHMLLALPVVLALVGRGAPADEPARGGKKVPTRVFELRIYHAAPGKMQALNERFRKHTNKHE